MKINTNKLFSIFRYFSYLPWIFDIIITLFVIATFIVIISITITNQNWLGTISSFLYLIVLPYSINNFLTKRINDKKELDNFKLAANHIFNDCQNMLAQHFNDVEKYAADIENKIVNTHRLDWEKHQNIKSLEYDLLESYLNHFTISKSLEESDKLFLKYRLITSSYNSYFPKLVNELEKADFYTRGTAHHLFIKKLYFFLNNKEYRKEFDNDDITDEQINETVKIALKRNNQLIEKLIKESENKKKLEFLLNKCFENAYTNIGNLDLKLKDDTNRTLIFMFKYDERFTIPKRIWSQEIKTHLTNKLGNQEGIDREYEKAKKELDSVIYPQPFSKALADFRNCITQIGNDKFSFIIDPEQFPEDAIGWSPEKFIKNIVIPKARQYLDAFNKRLVKEFPYLKKHQKSSLDTNYYLFFFNRKHFKYFADQESIPAAIKRFLIKEILNSEKAAEHLASQLIYIKQVINNLSISGLLFTEELQVQESVRKCETKIMKKAQKEGITINNIYDLVSIGNEFEKFVRIFFEVYYNKELKRRGDKKYSFIKDISNKMVENARELINIFNQIKATE